MLPRSMTNARLTGVEQRRGAQVVLISCLAPVLNVGLPVTRKKVISLEAAANDPLSLPFLPLRIIVYLRSASTERAGNERRQ